MYNILVLEDDSLFASSIEDFLQSEGFFVDLASCANECLALNYEKNYDLYIFDINLPTISGIELLKDLKQSNDNTPTIFLTSYKDKETLKDAYNCGCDDYIRKPVDLDELLLKIKALLKRYNKYFENIDILEDIVFNPIEKRVYKNSIDLNLPAKATALLELFIENKDSIITKEQIISKLWNTSQNHSEGAIRVYINQIKNLFTKKDIIKNIKGIGYKIEL